MGLFASIIKEKYPHLPIEDEGRLRDFQIREHFLKKIYAFSRFHQAKSAGNTKSLIDFHSKYKYLFIAHKEKTAREMGKLIASYKKGNENEIFQQYEALLSSWGIPFISQVIIHLSVVTSKSGHFCFIFSKKSR